MDPGSYDLISKCFPLGESWGTVRKGEEAEQGSHHRPSPEERSSSLILQENSSVDLVVPVWSKESGPFIFLPLSHWLRTVKGEYEYPDTSSSPPSWAKWSSVAWGKSSKTELWSLCVSVAGWDTDIMATSYPLYISDTLVSDEKMQGSTWEP